VSTNEGFPAALTVASIVPITFGAVDVLVVVVAGIDVTSVGPLEDAAHEVEPLPCAVKLTDDPDVSSATV
jgi:hypothetical protein